MVLFFTHIPFVVNRVFQRNVNGEVATIFAMGLGVNKWFVEVLRRGSKQLGKVRTKATWRASQNSLIRHNFDGSRNSFTGLSRMEHICANETIVWSLKLVEHHFQIFLLKTSSFLIRLERVSSPKARTTIDWVTIDHHVVITSVSSPGFPKPETRVFWLFSTSWNPVFFNYFTRVF